MSHSWRKLWKTTKNKMKTKKRLRNGPIVVLLGFLCALLFGLATTALASPLDNTVPIPINEGAYVAPPNPDGSAAQNTLNNLDVAANYAIPNSAFNGGAPQQIANNSASIALNNSAGANVLDNASAPPANTAGINSSSHNRTAANYTENYTDIANYANVDRANYANATRATANQATVLRKGGLGHESALTASGVILVVIEKVAQNNSERMAGYGTELATIGIGAMVGSVANQPIV